MKLRTGFPRGRQPTHMEDGEKSWPPWLAFLFLAIRLKDGGRGVLGKV